jgi:hypothetical protein
MVGQSAGCPPDVVSLLRRNGEAQDNGFAQDRHQPWREATLQNLCQRSGAIGMALPVRAHLGGASIFG